MVIAKPAGDGTQPRIFTLAGNELHAGREAGGRDDRQHDG